MRHRKGFAAALLTFLPFAVLGLAPAPAIAKDTCHGTSVHFVDSPSEAARQALKEHKLVFVLHLSGIFEDPNLT